MYVINPAQVPNQEFDTFVEGVRYHFRLHLFRDMLYADVTAGDTIVARSVRCIDREWLFLQRPKDMEGNFRFESKVEGQYPDYMQFGDGCQLCFYTNAEIAAMQ